MKNVAILANNFKPDRYSYMAFNLLREYGHNVFPVGPVLEELDSIKVYRKIRDIPVSLDTITLYLNPFFIKPIMDEIIEKQPALVLFNPGTESDELETLLKESHIRTLRACTLVLLRTGRFEHI